MFSQFREHLKGTTAGSIDGIMAEAEASRQQRLNEKENSARGRATNKPSPQPSPPGRHSTATSHGQSAHDESVCSILSSEGGGPLPYMPLTHPSVTFQEAWDSHRKDWMIGHSSDAPKKEEGGYRDESAPGDFEEELGEGPSTSVGVPATATTEVSRTYVTSEELLERHRRRTPQRPPSPGRPPSPAKRLGHSLESPGAPSLNQRTGSTDTGGSAAAEVPSVAPLGGRNGGVPVSVSVLDSSTVSSIPATPELSANTQFIPTHQQVRRRTTNSAAQERLRASLTTLVAGQRQRAKYNTPFARTLRGQISEADDLIQQCNAGVDVGMSASGLRTQRRTWCLQLTTYFAEGFGQIRYSQQSDVHKNRRGEGGRRSGSRPVLSPGEETEGQRQQEGEGEGGGGGEGGAIGSGIGEPTPKRFKILKRGEGLKRYTGTPPPPSSSTPGGEAGVSAGARRSPSASSRSRPLPQQRTQSAAGRKSSEAPTTTTAEERPRASSDEMPKKETKKEGTADGRGKETATAKRKEPITTYKDQASLEQSEFLEAYAVKKHAEREQVLRSYTASSSGGGGALSSPTWTSRRKCTSALVQQYFPRPFVADDDDDDTNTNELLVRNKVPTLLPSSVFFRRWWADNAMTEEEEVILLTDPNSGHPHLVYDPAQHHLLMQLVHQESYAATQKAQEGF